MAKPKLKPTTAAPIAKPKAFLRIILSKKPFLNVSDIYVSFSYCHIDASAAYPLRG